LFIPTYRHPHKTSIELENNIDRRNILRKENNIENKIKCFKSLYFAASPMVVSLLKHGLRRQKMALDVSFGDGTSTPISVWEMHQFTKTRFTIVGKREIF
jgi:hypothetical protein